MRIDELKQITSAQVYKKNLLAGILTRTAQGCKFEYDEKFPNDSEGISYTMPSTQRSYEVNGVNLPPFFAGLLPEGIRLTTLIAQIKTSTDDLLSLLLAVGDNCIGDVRIVLPNEDLQATEADEAELNETDFHELFKSSLGIANTDDLRNEPAIPGVQEKISLRRISLPLKFSRKKQKAFILKLNPPGKELMVENEAFFLSLAQACGIEVNEAIVIRDKNNNPGLLVERFDRVYDPKTKTMLSVHQEDACQFLDKYPADKYRIPYADIARGIEKFSAAPILEIAKLLRLIAYSYIIGNGDLHAKNISLRTNFKSDRIELTPAYDILSTLPYGDRKMALKLDAKDDSLNRSMFVKFGSRFGLRAPVIAELLDDLCENATPWILRVPEIGFNQKRTKDIQRTMESRIKDLRD